MADCKDHGACKDTEYCHKGDPKDDKGKCERRLATGETCADHRQCVATDYCDATSKKCTTLKKANDACAAQEECASPLHCHQTDKKCVDLKKADAACTYHGECEPTLSCHKSVKKCTLRQKYGFPCEDHEECEDKLGCGFGTCLVRCDSDKVHCAKSHTCLMDTVEGKDRGKFCKPDMTILEHLKNNWYFYLGGILLGVILVAVIVIFVNKKRKAKKLTQE